jgi:hypothetical protein
MEFEEIQSRFSRIKVPDSKKGHSNGTRLGHLTLTFVEQ